MNIANKSQQQIIIVTGLSGAGKTGVLRALEDIGFYCIDNLPVPLFTTFLSLSSQTPHLAKVALGIDIRSEQFLPLLMQEIEQIKQLMSPQMLSVLFLSAQDTTLIKRFQATRRSHPLAQNMSLLDALHKERLLLTPIQSLATITLETDNLTIHNLREWVRSTFSQTVERSLLVNIISFGFKYGIPIDSNMLFDVRFLPNPYFVPTLKNYDGRDSRIVDYLFNHQSVNDYWQMLHHFIDNSLQRYFQEGHVLISIGIGCTGGKHRSVAFAEQLHKTPFKHVTTLLQHRDVGKE